MEKTFNPCDVCGYSFSKQNQESGMCRICEFRKMLDLEERLQAVYGECGGLLEKAAEHLERHENVEIPERTFKARLLTDGEVDKWEEYKTLDKQGKLPCAVGDTVWDNDFGQPCSYTVTGFSIGKIDDEENDIEGLQMYYQNWNGSMRCSCAVSEINKTVFLTKSAAEAALKELERGRGE